MLRLRIMWISAVSTATDAMSRPVRLSTVGNAAVPSLDGKAVREIGSFPRGEESDRLVAKDTDPQRSLVGSSLVRLVRPERMRGCKTRIEMQGQESRDMYQEKVVAGIDVGKANLDVCIAPSGEARQFRNDAGGRRGLRKMLHKAEVELVVVEATGRYHRDVHKSLHDAGFRVAVVSPLQARRFAQALGQLAKTDPIDAVMQALDQCLQASQTERVATTD